MEYPDDFRNQRSADALRALAEYVRSLPDDDPRIEAVRAYDDLYGLVSVSGVEGASYPAARIGFRNPTHRDAGFDPDWELSAYVERGLADQLEAAEEMTREEWAGAVEKATAATIRRIQARFLSAALDGDG